MVYLSSSSTSSSDYNDSIDDILSATVFLATFSMSSSPNHSHIDIAQNAERADGTEEPTAELEDAQLSPEPTTTGIVSTKSSRTQIGLMSNAKDLEAKEELAMKESTKLSRESSNEPSRPVEKAEKHMPPPRSKMQSIMLVATCTIAMILNVSLSSTTSFFI